MVVTLLSFFPLNFLHNSLVPSRETSQLARKSYLIVDILYTLPKINQQYLRSPKAIDSKVFLNLGLPSVDTIVLESLCFLKCGVMGGEA